MRISDWSSDVCSSDLICGGIQVEAVLLVNFPVLFDQRGDALVDVVDRHGRRLLCDGLNELVDVCGNPIPACQHSHVPPCSGYMYDSGYMGLMVGGRKDFGKRFIFGSRRRFSRSWDMVLDRKSTRLNSSH